MITVVSASGSKKRPITGDAAKTGEAMNAAGRGRRTIVVHTKLAGHAARVAAARGAESGVQIMTMGQLAARLAGGLLRPVDPDALSEAVRESLPAVSMGELEPIKDLPGMVRAAVSTLDKVWRAGIDLSAGKHARLQALRALEEEVLRRLPPSMKRPAELVALACKRVTYATAVLGPLEIQGHSEMSPCWRPLLKQLAEILPVTWIAGPRHVPDWLRETKVDIRVETPDRSKPALYSCANPQHEVVEAFRWMRALLASGTPADEIAIAAASPADFDDHVLAWSRDSNIPVHFVHGIKAITGRDGQTAAALGETLVKGISQERVRRLFALLRSPLALREVPPEWTRLLPADAPLTTIERWEQVFARTDAADWPEGIDRSAAVLRVLRLIAKGPQAAEEVGENLLTGVPLALWRRALEDGPAAALPVTLTRVRSDDGIEPAANVIWASAIALASSPRAHVRLLALNAGRWPRRISEDRLIPDHVLPLDELDPLPVADGDKRDFATIIASAKSATISYSRRDVEGRLLGRSPLVGDLDEIYLGRARIPEHVASDADRLLARPTEFRTLPVAISGLSCWRDWYRPEITAHDGLIGRNHPRLQRVFERPLSATSLKLLLRDPIRFIWRYALGWKQPEEADEPLTIDGLAFGNLVHGLLRTAVDALEAAGGLAAATPSEIEEVVGRALGSTITEWESEQPVPPRVIWQNVIERTRKTSTAALGHPLEALVGQKSWTEIPFGTDEDGNGRDLPWRPDEPVHIPGTSIRIQGHIDRLDLSADNSRARVLDYKTGKLNKKMADVVIKGGGELQRCLYAFAVKTLLAHKGEIEAALLYPGAADGEQALFPLGNLDAVLDKLAAAIALACDSLLSGIAVPGIDADDDYNDFSFALPANAGYLPRKLPLARERLGPAANIWDEP